MEYVETAQVRTTAAKVRTGAGLAVEKQENPPSRDSHPSAAMPLPPVPGDCGYGDDGGEGQNHAAQP